MKKRAPNLNRRRKALRAAVGTLAAWLVMVHVMHIGLLFPRQAIWQLEERAGIAHAAYVVERSRTPEIRASMLTYLVGNEEAAMLGSTYLTLHGWMPGFSIALDCTEEAPLHAGVYYMSRDGQSVRYVFGRVEDPEIIRVEVSLCPEEADEQGHSVVGGEVRRLTDLTLTERDGHRYFLAKDGEPWEAERRAIPVVYGYDAAGREVLRLEVTEDWLYSGF